MLQLFKMLGTYSVFDRQIIDMYDLQKETNQLLLLIFDYWYVIPSTPFILVVERQLYAKSLGRLDVFEHLNDLTHGEYFLEEKNKMSHQNFQTVLYARI